LNDVSDTVPMTPAPEPDNAPSVGGEASIFLRVWAIFGLVLFATTWKLWTPQVVYPQVPVFEFLVNVPAIIDWIAFALVGFSIALLAIQPSLGGGRVRWPMVMLAASLLVSFSLDQHRLQPWAWHWFVFAIVFVLAKVRDATFWVRWIVTSVYVYSAISKLDYQFTHSVGLEMLHAMADLIGVSLVERSTESLSRVVLLLPLIELLVGVGLTFAATRMVFGSLAVLLHLGLLLTLGPLGLNHQSPVLIWNAFFVFQAYWLFVRREEPEFSGQPRMSSNWLVAAFALAVILFPATCSFSGCDHWLAWELYAPRSSRVTIELPASAVDQLPSPAADHAKESQHLPGVMTLDLAAWSLKELGVPVYPQSRFQLGVARAVSEQLDNDRALRVTIKSRSDRRTGKRTAQQVRGTMKLEKQSATFWLNTRPRRFDRSSEKPLAN